MILSTSTPKGVDRQMQPFCLGLEGRHRSIETHAVYSITNHRLCTKVYTPSTVVHAVVWWIVWISTHSHTHAQKSENHFAPRSQQAALDNSALLLLPVTFVLAKRNNNRAAFRTNEQNCAQEQGSHIICVLRGHDDWCGWQCVVMF